MKTILLVDDDEDVLASFHMLLKNVLSGVSIETATSVKAAVRRLKQPGIDLVVSDVSLKNAKGSDIQRRVPSAKIVYISGDRTWRGPNGEEALSKLESDEIIRVIKTKLGESMNVRQVLQSILSDELSVDDAIDQLVEVSPPGFSGTTLAMKKHRKITNPYALSWWMYKRGAHPHKTPKAHPKGLKNYVPPEDYEDRKK